MTSLLHDKSGRPHLHYQIKKIYEAILAYNLGMSFLAENATVITTFAFVDVHTYVKFAEVDFEF